MRGRVLLQAGVLAGAFALWGGGSGSHAAVIVSDTFEDNGRTDGADPLDIPWYIAAQNQTLTVVPSTFAGGGSTRALAATPGSADQFKRIVGFFTTQSLSIGDTMSLSVAFRGANANVATANANGFRFGLYNSNGTRVTADTSSTSFDSSEPNDVGYNVRIPTGTAAAPAIFEEPAGDNTLGGTTPGTAITNAGATSIVVNDQLLHNLILSISRTGSSSLDFTFSFDGNVVATATDTTPTTTSFDAIYFGTGAINALAYEIDNVEVSVVPEPGTISLAGLCATGLLARRRRCR